MAQVLVIEDDPCLRANISELLQAHGHDVKVAATGKQALETLTFFLPNLILCDVAMPEMNGIDFIRTTKRISRYRYIPFIFLTARISQQDRILGLQEGAIDYMAKPFQSQELLLKIQNITSQQTELLQRWVYEIAGPNENDFQFTNQLLNLLDQQYTNPSFTLEKAAALMHCSLSALQRNLKKYGQKHFSELLKEYRLQKACQYLIQTDYSLQKIAHQCGFNSLSYFSSCFKEAHQVSPLRFRRHSQSRKTTE